MNRGAGVDWCVCSDGPSPVEDHPLLSSGTDSHPHTLIVEDKDSLRAMLRHALEGQDYIVAEAVDESGAVAALRENRPSVVLTDLRLPQGDGFGVLRAAKELDPWHDHRLE